MHSLHRKRILTREEASMAHWEHRPEAKWKDFQFNQPYAKGLAKLREVLKTTDFDPATLWQWGTMQAMALIEVLKDCEATFGEEGQKVVFGALRKVGLDIGRQILKGTKIPDGMTEAEFVSFYATVLNRIAYASLEDPKLGQDEATFDILWCPHQDHYGAFDCRVQRYFVQGMIEAAKEFAGWKGFEIRFDSTIPAGAPTCHFTAWKPAADERQAWEKKTAELERRALDAAKRLPIKKD
jgi:hypothetical protein